MQIRFLHVLAALAVNGVDARRQCKLRSQSLSSVSSTAASSIAVSSGSVQPSTSASTTTSIQSTSSSETQSSSTSVTDSTSTTVVVTASTVLSTTLATTTASTDSSSSSDSSSASSSTLNTTTPTSSIVTTATTTTSSSSNIVIASSSQSSSATTTSTAPAQTTTPAEVFTGGFATWYNQNGVAGDCGDVNADQDLIAAIDSNRYGDINQRSPYCNRSIRITNTNNGRSVVVVIKAACTTCINENSIDLSQGAFSAIAALSEGMVPIQYQFV